MRSSLRSEITEAIDDARTQPGKALPPHRQTAEFFRATSLEEPVRDSALVTSRLMLAAVPIFARRPPVMCTCPSLLPEEEL